MWRIVACLFLLALTTAPARASGRHKKAIDAAKLAEYFSQGAMLLRTNELPAAMKDFQKADKISHHTCYACYLAMADVKRRMGDLSGALHEDDHALKAAGSNKKNEANVHLARGVLLSQMANGSKDNKLRKAAGDFREALQLDPSLVDANFDLGVLLLREKRVAEGVAKLKSYVALPGAAPATVAQARRIIANPSRAWEPYLPDFSLATLKGNTVTPASLAGKVALLDFWATWCPACRESVAMVKDIAKHYKGRVEIVGISDDGNRAAWKTYVAKHHMDWVQTIDPRFKLGTELHLEFIPTFIVVDRRGIERLQTDGSGIFGEARIENAINKALKQPYPDPAKKKQ